MARVIEERLVDEAESPLEEWGPADAASHREVRHFRTSADFRIYVREWNRRARSEGSFIRIRSVEIEEN